MLSCPPQQWTGKGHRVDRPRPQSRDHAGAHGIAPADDTGIPVQLAVWEFFGSDGGVLIQQRIPTALIALQTRYTHETYDLEDFEGALGLLFAFLTTFPAG